MPQQLWYVRHCSLFERLSDAQLSLLELRASLRTFARNTPIFLPTDQTDCVFLLATGRVRMVSITPDGKQAILALIEPGELFGELALLQQGQREERAEAVTDATVVRLPGEELRRLMETSVDVSLGITKLIGLRRRRIERRLRNLLFRSNRERLAHLLLELAEQYGRQTAQGILLDIKLSHQELSSIIGATRETVTVLLGEMQSEGLLIVNRRQITVQHLRLATQLGVTAPAIVGPLPPRVAPPVHTRLRSLPSFPD